LSVVVGIPGVAGNNFPHLGITHIFSGVQQTSYMLAFSGCKAPGVERWLFPPM